MWLIQMLVWSLLTRRTSVADVRRVLTTTGSVLVQGEQAVMRSRAARMAVVAALALVAGYTVLMLRSRSRAKAITDGFPCRARLITPSTGQGVAEFPRRNLTGHWVHDVLVLHPGRALATVDDSYGVAELVGGPVTVAPSEFGSLGDLVSLRYRLDSGDILELLCARQDEARAIGPFLGSSSVRAV